jgi:8-oxo-dGTP pyrophosphatase MutT (NUDIX family)
MEPAFSRGVEVGAACLIRNPEGRIFMARNTRQGGKWTMPGGHVEPGERIMDAAVREAKEETGLDCRAVEVVHFDETINPPDFHRAIHMIFFDVLLEVVGGEVSLQQDELTEYRWCTPEEAALLDLASGYEKDIRAYIAYLARHA